MVRSLVIGGQNVYAATELRNGSVRVVELRRRERRVVRAFPSPIPVGARAGYELADVKQSLRLEASDARLAVLRTVRAVWRPDCFRRGCRRASIDEALLTELYVARPGEPLARLMRVDHRADRCALTPTHVAVSGSTVAYVARFGEMRGCARGRSLIGVVAFRGDTLRHERVLTVRRGEVTALAIAGPYVAWASRRAAPCPCVTLVLSDWRKGVTRYRLGVQRLDVVDDMAMTRAGAVALAAHRERNGCVRSEIVLVPAIALFPRTLRAPGATIGGFDGARLVHATFGRRSCSRSVPRIVITDVRGRTRVIRRVSAAPNGIAFDGRHVVYALPLRPASTPSPQVVYRQRVG
jgi:hypothetical protein